MSRRRLPPLNSLRAFEAAARHQNLSRAADELAVTHSAVSHHVAKLEDFLGTKLFERRPRQLLLNKEGAEYAERLQAVFDEIERATISSFFARSAPDTLRIGVPPTFAMRFLMPRLARFKRQFPRLTLRIETPDHPLHPNVDEVDVAIWWSIGAGTDLVCEQIFREVLNPVGSPDLINGHRLETADDLEPFLLLHARNRPYEWRRWLQAAHATRIDGRSGLRLGHSALAFQGAANGLGIALGQPEFVHGDIKSGRLVPLLDKPLLTEYSFHAVYSAKKPADSRITDFTGWLKREAESAHVTFGG